ncbi:MAG TPA: cob(I)yrinic acid a,c-diamide adenosyltransferase [Candidatus Paceibacterota bacterium]|nr:cob(I)yrinic acid a,c-diamide adenosyltransferase [Candidatus Paceibacterota bacterium]
MVIVFTGDGKGKTTASLGQMVRVTGRGKRALMIQFIKGSWEAGEHVFGGAYKIPEDTFHVRRMGKGFVGILGDKRPRAEHEQAAREALELFKMELTRKVWDLIVLDEVNVAVSLGLISAKAVLEAIKDFPEEKLLIMSGRGAPPEFIERADLATEMKELKHPFADGKMGKLGVEF